MCGTPSGFTGGRALAEAIFVHTTPLQFFNSRLGYSGRRRIILRFHYRPEIPEPPRPARLRFAMPRCESIASCQITIA